MLTGRQKRHLRGLAHSRHPLVRVGNNGATQAVAEELDRTLAHHELVKIKVESNDREERRDIITSLGEQCSAEIVQTIGKIAVLFRRNPDEPKITLP